MRKPSKSVHERIREDRDKRNRDKITITPEQVKLVVDTLLVGGSASFAREQFGVFADELDGFTRHNLQLLTNLICAAKENSDVMKEVENCYK